MILIRNAGLSTKRYVQDKLILQYVLNIYDLNIIFKHNKVAH